MKRILLCLPAFGAILLSGCGGGGGGGSSTPPPDLSVLTPYVGTYSGTAHQQSSPFTNAITFTVNAPYEAVDGPTAFCGGHIADKDYGAEVDEPIGGTVQRGQGTSLAFTGHYQYIIGPGGGLTQTVLYFVITKQSDGTWTGTMTPDSGLPISVVLTKSN